MTVKFNHVRVGDVASVTAFIDGEMYVADNTHPNWKQILNGLDDGDTSVTDLFDISAVAVKRFDRLSERVSVANGRVFFDGEEVDNALTKKVAEFVNAGVENFKPLVKFFENVMVNPNEHSREQLYVWLTRHDFPINDDGHILAYKGVKADDSKFVSINTGTATVDGVVHNGAIPNHVGAVVEMPRGEVEDNSGVGCATGLHAGTWDYASKFARGAVLTVVINPRDVVSVPTDCDAQKVRVSRYVVKEIVEQAYDSPYVTDYEAEDFDGADDYDELDGYYNDTDVYGNPTYY